LKYIVEQENERDIGLITRFYKRIKNFEESEIESSASNFIQRLNLEIESGEAGSLDVDIEKGPDAVKIMTIHGAKGLEFKYVFVPNLVDKRFPTIERREPIEIPQELVKEILPKGDVHLQEERRLFYVAMTRAKRGLFLTSADDYGGQRKKKPSRFLAELNLKLINKKESGIRKDELGSPIAPRRLEKAQLAANRLPPYFSYSQFAAFEKCPLQYKFAHILKVPRRGKPVFSFGKTIHNTLYQFVKSIVSQKGKKQKGLFQSHSVSSPSSKGIADAQEYLKEALEIYENNWLDEWYEDKKQKDEYYKLGKEVLKNFVENFVKERPKIKFIEGSPGLEKDFRLKIKNNTIKGKIDRIDELPEGEIEIIDYKTGQAPAVDAKGKAKLKKEDKEQLLIYQLAGEQILGKLPEKLSYYYLKGNKKVSFSTTEKEREEFKDEILRKIDKIKNSDFKATPGWQCKSCDFKDICEFRKLN